MSADEKILHKAAEIGDLDKLEELLQKGHNFKVDNPDEVRDWNLPFRGSPRYITTRWEQSG